MSSEGYNPYRPPIDTILERLSDRFSDFEPAVRQAGMIPREGIHTEAAINLSVAPSTDHFESPYFPKTNADIADLEIDMAHLWEKVHQKREGVFVAETGNRNPHAGIWLPSVAFAPDTDTLFRDTIAPVLRERTALTGKNKLVVPDLGYPLPFWFRDELDGVEIVEGKKVTGSPIHSQLERYIKEGKKLPNDIGAVYLDYPSTVDATYIGDDLIKFIRQNPNVLFIVDQANLYFSRPLVYETSRDMTAQIPRFQANYGKGTKAMDCLVFVTNTTSKTMGKSGSASISATERATKLLETTSGKESPQFVGFTEESLRSGCDTLGLESNLGKSERDNQTIGFRDEIDRARKMVWEAIVNEFGSEALPYPTAKYVGPHLFVDAKALGFPDGEALCDYLASEFSIGTKTAKWYGDTVKHPELLDYVYIGVPVKSEHLKILQAALKRIRERKNSQTQTSSTPLPRLTH